MPLATEINWIVVKIHDPGFVQLHSALHRGGQHSSKSPHPKHTSNTTAYESSSTHFTSRIPTNKDGDLFRYFMTFSWQPNTYASVSFTQLIPDLKPEMRWLTTISPSVLQTIPRNSSPTLLMRNDPTTPSPPDPTTTSPSKTTLPASTKERTLSEDLCLIVLNGFGSGIWGRLCDDEDSVLGVDIREGSSAGSRGGARGRMRIRWVTRWPVTFKNAKERESKRRQSIIGKEFGGTHHHRYLDKIQSLPHYHQRTNALAHQACSYKTPDHLPETVRKQLHAFALECSLFQKPVEVHQKQRMPIILWSYIYNECECLGGR